MNDQWLQCLYLHYLEMANYIRNPKEEFFPNPLLLIENTLRFYNFPYFHSHCIFIYSLSHRPTVLLQLHSHQFSRFFRKNSCTTSAQLMPPFIQRLLVWY